MYIYLFLGFELYVNFLFPYHRRSPNNKGMHNNNMVLTSGKYYALGGTAFSSTTL